MPVSFFCKQPAAKVWRSVTGVSAAGLRRGRGKGTGKQVAKDFNRGQTIGIGRSKIVMAGLNAPVISANKLVDIQDLGANSEFKESLAQVRANMNTYRKSREAPIDRGWAGRKAHGRPAGPPDPFNEAEFVGFESRVLMLRNIFTMTGNLGRTRRAHALVVTGNGNGLAGFSTAIGNDMRGVVRHARNRAAQNLISIKRWEDRTVMHDFFSKYYYNTLFVERKPEGYGIHAHRALIAICHLFGIKDIRVKIEGPSNIINITKAFFLGLMNQRDYQGIADDKQLHLVELRDEYNDFPFVLASPKGPLRDESQIKNSGENLDFTYYIYDGKIRESAKPDVNVWEGHKYWYKHLARLDFEKNREMTKILLAAKYGDRKVLDVFPHFISNAESFNKPKKPADGDSLESSS